MSESSNDDPITNILPKYDVRYSSGTVINPEIVYQQFISSATLSSPSSSAPIKHRILISYDDQDKIALDIVKELSTQLEEKFEILLASQSISSHQKWYGDLYTAIGLSHAAVLLLSKDMLQSINIQKTMNLLTARTLKHVDLFNFILVPVLTDHIQFSSSDFTDSKHISLKLKTLSPIQSSDPVTICSQVLNRLDSLEKPPRYTNLNILGQKIGELLRTWGVPAEYLAKILNKDIDSKIDPFEQIAWAMWRTSIFTISDLHKYLEAFLSGTNRKELLKILFPSWVDPWSALWVPIATERSPGERAIMLNGQRDEIVNCFVRRAYCCFYDHHFTKMIIDMSCHSNDGSAISELILHIRRELLSKFRGKEQGLEARLCNYTTQHGPIFIVMHLMGSQDIAQLMKEFKYVTFFFLTDGNLPEDISSFENVIFPQPVLYEEDLNAYDTYYQFIHLL